MPNTPAENDDLWRMRLACENRPRAAMSETFGRAAPVRKRGTCPLPDGRGSGNISFTTARGITNLDRTRAACATNNSTKE